VRLVASKALLALAVVAGLLAVGALRNLWSDYRDSPASTHLVIGVPSLAVCAAALLGVWLLRRRR
jgi:uncharacterized protein (TIGR03382 family)